MSVGVVVPGDLTEEKRARIAELVRMAAGINEGRGDAVSVQPLSQIDSLVEHADGAEATEVEPASPAPAVSAVPQFDRFVVLGAGALLFAVVLVLLLLIWRRAPRTLSSQDRQRVLEEIQRALAEEGSVAAGRAR
jgi:flagellar biosynthesis/type III secretory pathway M-ring protein FliF/YscJ